MEIERLSDRVTELEAELERLRDEREAENYTRR
jgi:hypothetical protein